MITSVEDLLLTQSILTLIILLIFAYLLHRKELFRWNSAGFWTWSAFFLYFFLNPLASSIWNVSHYRYYLSISGGLSRGEWIGFVSLIGIIVFFISYLSFHARAVNWLIRSDHFSSPMKLLVAVFGLLGIFSFLYYRLYIGSHSQQFSIVAGRFIGQTSGYAYGAHMFLFFVIISLLLSDSSLNKLVACVLILGYIGLSFQAMWSRFTTISLLIAVSLALTSQSKHKWPGYSSLAAIIAMTVILVVRGHAPVSSSRGVLEVVSSIPERAGSILAAGDTAMLASWYAESYVKDEITGYDYGIPLLNYVFFGAIPGRIFPEKYFLIDWLESIQRPLTDPSLVAALYGAKSTLFGSFYAHGGFLGVLLFSVFIAYLSRKLDGLIHEDSPTLVKTAGICLLSVLWMAWGSSDYWSLMTMGTLVLPAIVVWIVAPKTHQPARRESYPHTSSAQSITHEQAS